jgi:peptidoglycan/xylan/chitin deacetylase (PgdA/CDA1 family)
VKKANTTIPILLYHSIGRPSRKQDTPIFVSAERFARQMRFLKKEKYRTIDLVELAAILRKGLPLPVKRVAITFDDGTRTVYDNAFPVLKRLGFTATVFLAANYIEEKKMPEKSFLHYSPLTWGMIKKMRRAGISFQPHTMTHPRLTEISIGCARKEIRESKEVLRSRLGTEPSVFAYPYGDHDGRIKKAVKEAGFAAAVGASGGVNTKGTDPFALKRVFIFESDTDACLKTKLISGFDAPVRGHRN